MADWSYELLEPPGDGVCDGCGVYVAQGVVRAPSGRVFSFCRSCMSPLRRRLKSLFKLMEGRAHERNQEEGRSCPR